VVAPAGEALVSGEPFPGTESAAATVSVSGAQLADVLGDLFVKLQGLVGGEARGRHGHAEVGCSQLGGVNLKELLAIVGEQAHKVEAAIRQHVIGDQICRFVDLVESPHVKLHLQQPRGGDARAKATIVRELGLRRLQVPEEGRQSQLVVLREPEHRE